MNDVGHARSLINSLLVRCAGATLLLAPLALQAQRSASECGDSSATHPLSEAELREHTGPDAKQELATFVLRRLSPATVTLLRQQLRACAWLNARRLLFGEGEHPQYVDWVVYIDSAANVRQEVVNGAGPLHVLDGERYIWVLVLSDRDLVANHQPQPDSHDMSDVRIARRVIAYHPDPLITSIAKGVGKAVSIAPPTDETLADSTQGTAFQELSSDSGRASLFVAQGRFGLANNTQVELSVSPVSWKTFEPWDGEAAHVAPIRSIFTTIANVHRQIAELSIAAGISTGAPYKTYDASGAVKSTTPGSQLNAYMLGMLNLPVGVHFPWQSPSWRASYPGIGFGTNVARGSFGDELLVVGALSRVLGDAGLMAGADWTVETAFQNKQIVNRRRPRFIAAIDVRL